MPNNGAEADEVKMRSFDGHPGIYESSIKKIFSKMALVPLNLLRKRSLRFGAT